MQKELIYDKMNGFLTERMPSVPEGAVIEDEFAEGKECVAFCTRGYTGQGRTCVND